MQTLAEKKSNINFQYRPKPLDVRKDSVSADFPLHWHSQLEMMLIVEGVGRFMCNSEIITAYPGDVVIYNCNDLHQGKGTPGSVRYECIIVDLLMLESKHQDIGELKSIKTVLSNLMCFHNLISNDRFLNDIFMEIVEEAMEKRDCSELAIRADLMRMFVHLVRFHVKQTFSQSERRSRIKNLIRFRSVMDYISEHYREPILLENLAADVSLSKYHFCRLFKELAGTNVSSFILEYRIGKAIELMETTDENVSEAAYACGFTDVNYFSRQFKRLKGYSPSQILRQRVVK